LDGLTSGLMARRFLFASFARFDALLGRVVVGPL
jgi:hypothetical protein